MARLTYAISLVTIFAAASACGSKNSSTPDAPVIQTTDAPPPIDGMPDALVCTAPDMQCVQGACTNTNTDEQNCGTCGNVCKGGAYCKPQPDGCTCPGAFLPDPLNSSGVLAVNQQISSQLDLNIDFGGVGAANGLNGLVLIVSPKTTQTKHNYTLSDPTGGGIPMPPIVSAVYGFDISARTADASYVATAGTINFDVAKCVPSGTGMGSEFAGTLTNVTLQGVKGDLLSGQAQVDPNGCSITITKLTFDIVSDQPCTP